MQHGLSSPQAPYGAEDSDHFRKNWENSLSSPVLLAAHRLADVQGMCMEIQNLHLLKACPGAIFYAREERLNRHRQNPWTRLAFARERRTHIQARGTGVVS